MKLVPIFVGEDSGGGLWSILLNEKEQSEFEIFFDQVNDVEWLYNFFDKNRGDLHGGFFGSLSIKGAVSRTLEEAEEMEEALYDLSEQGFEGEGGSLQEAIWNMN